MSATLYEQFFAIGSVKSLLTGKIVDSPYKIQPPTDQAKIEKDLPVKTKRQNDCK